MNSRERMEVEGDHWSMSGEANSHKGEPCWTRSGSKDICGEVHHPGLLASPALSMISLLYPVDEQVPLKENLFCLFSSVTELKHFKRTCQTGMYWWPGAFRNKQELAHSHRIESFLLSSHSSITSTLLSRCRHSHLLCPMKRRPLNDPPSPNQQSVSSSRHRTFRNIHRPLSHTSSYRPTSSFVK